MNFNKKQRLVWISDKDWKLLQDKMKEEGFEGRGAFGKFLEKIITHKLIFVSGDVGTIKISLED